MVKVLRLFVGALALVLFSAAPAPVLAKATDAAALPPAAARPALWKVADADTTIWLFGTIHALPQGVDWMNGPIEAALDGSAELVTEIPETDPAKMQAAILQNATLPPEKSLRAMMSDKDRAAYEKAMTEFGLPVPSLDRFQPWFAAITLTALPLAKSGYSASNGVEEQISVRAKKKGQPRTGLETAEAQLAMFASLPMDVQQTYLHEVVEGIPTLDQQLGDIIREWSQGNADRLAELLNAEEDDPRMVAALLTNRNRAWAEWLGKRLNQPGTVFVAVGAGHLAGKDCVQDFLKQRGITVSRVQ